MSILEGAGAESGAVTSWAGWRAETRRAVAELAGTALLLCAGCMAQLPVLGVPPHAHAAPSLLQASLAFGLVVLLCIQLVGGLSGAHINPAVTLGALVWGWGRGGRGGCIGTAPGRIGLRRAAVYVLSQFIGALLGSAMLWLMSPEQYASSGICCTQINPSINVFQGFMVEVFLTALLVGVCCALWGGASGDHSAPVKVGLTVCTLSLAGGALTGASMNPARSLGPALVQWQWAAHWVYWAGPVTGALLAAVAMRLLMPPPPSSPASAHLSLPLNKL